jgi:hypothetical protein
MFRGGRLLYFGPVISDLTDHFYLGRVFLCRWLQRGIYPFWDMHAFGGYPVLETQQHALLHPISLLSLLVFDPALGLKVWMMGAFAAGAAASFVALRRFMGMSAAASFLVTALFFFGGTMATRVEAGHFTVVAATAFWIPALACVWQLGTTIETAGWRHLAREPWAFIGASVAIAFVILAGAPQYVVYLFYVLLVGALIASGKRSGWWAMLGVLGAVWAVALALSAGQWFPTLYYLPFTGRSEGAWMMPPRPEDRVNLFVEMLLPWPLGDDLSFPHMHLKNVWETATYPGILGLVLAVGGLVGGLKGRARGCRAHGRLGLVLVLTGLYMCGGGWLPGFSSFREPMKARAVLALGIAMAAGAGYQYFAVAERARRVHRGGWGALPAGFLAAALGAAALAVSQWALGHVGRMGTWLLQGGPPVDGVRAPAWAALCRDPLLLVEHFVAASRQVALWALIGAFLLFAARWRPRVAMGFLVAATVLEPFSAHFRVFVARHPFAQIDFPPGFREAMGQELARSRARGELPWRVTLPASLANRGHLLEGLWDTGGYDPLMPRDANTRVALETRRLDLSVEEKRTTIGLAVGRRYDFTRWQPELGEPLGDLKRFEVAPSAALFSLERRLQPGYSGLMQFGPNLDTGRHYVDVAPPSANGAPPSPQVSAFVDRVEEAARSAHGPEMDRIEALETGSPNEFAYRVVCGSPALAIFRTTWLPGWQVWLDGRYAGRPWCANRWMLAVPLEAGSHVIRWRYRPVGFSACLAVSFASSVALGVWALRARRLRRKSASPQ